MEVDELRAEWTAHLRQVESRLRIDERALRRMLGDDVRRILRRSIAANAVGFGAILALTYAVARVFGAHLDDPGYLLCGGVTLLGLVALLVARLRLVIAASGIRFDAAVSVAQSRIELLRRCEYRTIAGALWWGCVIWLPLALLGLEAVLGAPLLGRVPQPWLYANVGFGVVLLLIGRALSRRFVESRFESPFARRIVDALSGKGLREATRRLDEIGELTAADHPPA
ncbi:MAG: hypothetical protein U1F36_13640 [Planctomycetota bacterium]